MRLLMSPIRPTILVPRAGGFGLGDRLWDLAGVAPSLDQRFAESQSLIDAVSGQQLITFTRASDGTFVGSNGLIQTAGTNVPRFDHNPLTGESLGLWVEEQRTNSIRNNTMVGAVAGSPGTAPTNWIVSTTAAGVSREIIGTGTENGITYIDIKVSGTTTSSLFFVIRFEGPQVVAAANGQTWTTSSYIKVVGGSLANLLLRSGINGNNSTGSGVQFPTNSTISPTGASLISQRFVNTGTFSNASVAFAQSYLQIEAASGVAIDITIRIGLPQLEQGAFATSVIPTSTTAVTRSASVVDVINQAIANNIRTLYLEFRSPASGTRGVVSLNDNTANERVNMLTSGTDPRLVIVDGGVEQANINGGTITANTRTRVAVRINENDFAISINGAAVVTDTSGTLPIVDRLMLGRTQAGEYLNGTLARVTGWREALPNSTLQSLAS
jgi:hypothetical protein